MGVSAYRHLTPADEPFRMARKLKTYQTAQGFFDMAIAAPSMKAALEAWGIKSNLFHQGFAWESDDPRVIEATTRMPGVTLRRPVGSKGKFVEHPSLPKELPAHARIERHPRPKKQAGKKASDRKGKPAKRIDEKAAKKAAAAYEKRQRRLELQQRREDAKRAKEDARKERAVGKVQAQLDKAEREHDIKVGLIEKERAALDQRAEAEDARWEKQRSCLEAARKRART
jgi:hypothetical protein